jgi:ATP-binding cassette, subfamily B, bacterial
MAFPFYQQADSMDCGPTCLQMVAKYYTRSIALDKLRKDSQIDKEGVSLLGLSEAAESIGFRTQAVKLSYSTLTTEALLPCILHWNQYHFVVLHKVKRNILYIADPAHGLVTFTKEEFSQRWISDRSEDPHGEGIVLLLEPTPGFYEKAEESLPVDENQKEALAFKNIFNYLLSYKKLIFQLILGLTVASLLQLILPFLTQSVIDIGVNTNNIQFVYVVLFAQGALMIGKLSVDFVQSWLLLHISTRINISILTDFLIKLMKLPLSFFDSKKTGDILQRMNDHQRIESFLTGSSVNVLVFSIALATFNITVFSVFIISSIAYSAWIILFLKKRKTLDYKRFDIASKEQSMTIQMVQGMQEIKLNSVEKSMRWSWERLQAKLFNLNMKGLALTQWQQSGASFINEGKTIYITFLSAAAVIDGQMTLGAMLAVQYIIGQLNSPIEQMIGFIQSWQNAKISMDRLNEIHGMPNEESAHEYSIKELPPAFTKQLVGGRDIITPDQAAESKDAIVVEHVSFTYPGAGNEPVLKDINLKIPKGKTTAIVGVSGSGKTTLLKLLLKFYEAQNGDIKLNAISLRNISHSTWRSHSSVVMQESFIFSDTIARNIAVGTQKIDMQRLHHAVEVANVLDLIERLPLGFNTQIGPEGAGISMGQRQRILIARAVYRDPEFIFFDEATNSLDANNESIILDNLESFFNGRTVVVVAHRLSTVKNADQIIVLDKGLIAERGTHRELVNLKGEYYTLVKNQLDLGD